MAVCPESPPPKITHMQAQSQNMFPRGQSSLKVLGSRHKVLSGGNLITSASYKGDDSGGSEGWIEVGIWGGKDQGRCYCSQPGTIGTALH